MYKVRTHFSDNYKGIFFNEKTIRQKIDNSLPFKSLKYSEIEDWEQIAQNRCYKLGGKLTTN